MGQKKEIMMNVHIPPSGEARNLTPKANCPEITAASQAYEQALIRDDQLRALAVLAKLRAAFMAGCGVAEDGGAK